MHIAPSSATGQGSRLARGELTRCIMSSLEELSVLQGGLELAYHECHAVLCWPALDAPLTPACPFVAANPA